MLAAGACKALGRSPLNAGRFRITPPHGAPPPTRGARSSKGDARPQGTGRPTQLRTAWIGRHGLGRRHRGRDPRSVDQGPSCRSGARRLGQPCVNHVGLHPGVPGALLPDVAGILPDGLGRALVRGLFLPGRNAASSGIDQGKAHGQPDHELRRPWVPAGTARTRRGMVGASGRRPRSRARHGRRIGRLLLRGATLADPAGDLDRARSGGRLPALAGSRQGTRLEAAGPPSQGGRAPSQPGARISPRDGRGSP